MSKSRKRAGTETATKSAPPTKKTRPRKSDTAPKDPATSNNGSKTTKTTKATTKTTVKTAENKKSSGTSNTASGNDTKPAHTKTRARAKDAEDDAMREADTLEEEGLAIVGDDGDDGAGDGDDGSEGKGEEEEDSEAELEAMKDKWDSTIYAFYEPNPTIEYVNGRRAHSFKCSAKRCRQHIRRYLDTKDHSSTSNMRRHAIRCWGQEAVEAAREAASVDEAREKIVNSILQSGSITAHFERKKGKITFSHRQHTRAETRVEIAKWVCESLRPFRIVSDPGFEMLMKTGRPAYYLPSPSTVARDVKSIFEKTRARIANMLQDHEGALHFATDTWTSPNHRAFVAVTVHFEKDGVPISMLLDIVEVAESHAGANLALAFAGILRDFGIERKILGVTCDNASNNKTMVDALADPESAAYLEEFEGHDARVRCFLHILSIVCGKNLVAQFDSPSQKAKAKAAEDAEEREVAELEEELANIVRDEVGGGAIGAGDGEGAADDDDDELDATGDLTEEEKRQFEKDVRPIRLLLVKMRNFASKVVNSSTLLLPEWKRVVDEHGLPPRVLPRDVRTRWNSTFDMLDACLQYRGPYDQMCARLENGLRRFEMSEDEWLIAKQLYKILKVFKAATLFFSRQTPNLAQVIPAMDHLDKVLATATISHKYAEPIRVACGIAKKALNRYYSYTDMSSTYRIAMMLHPGHKLAYFKKQRWPEKWQKLARQLLVDTYTALYAGRFGDDSRGSEEPAIDLEEEGPAGEDHESGSETSEDEDDIFAALASFSRLRAVDLGDEIERYLASPAEDVPDALRWWTEQRAIFPCLSRMARDYLTIPATSVEVERVFSRGRLLLSHVRSRLSVETTRAVLCVGAWSAAGYVKTEDTRAVAQLPEVEEDDVDAEFDGAMQTLDLDSDDDLPELMDVSDAVQLSGGDAFTTDSPQPRLPDSLRVESGIPLLHAASLIIDPSLYDFDNEPIFLWDSYSGGSSRLPQDETEDGLGILLSLRCRVASRPDGSQQHPSALFVEISGVGDMLELNLPLTFSQASASPRAAWISRWTELQHSPIYPYLNADQIRALRGICALMSHFSEDTPTTRAAWPSFRIQLLLMAQFCHAGITGEDLLLDLCRQAKDLPNICIVKDALNVGEVGLGGL